MRGRGKWLALALVLCLAGNSITAAAEPEMTDVHEETIDMEETQSVETLPSETLPPETLPGENIPPETLPTDVELGEVEESGLKVDTENLFAGMRSTYAEGYVPRVEKGTVFVVIPMESLGELRGDKLRVSLTLGDPNSGPFVCKNYEKEVSLQSVLVNAGTVREQEVERYVIEFALPCRADRFNGSYPIQFEMTGTTLSGQEVREMVTVYVTISDGKDPNYVEPMPQPEEPEPSFAPKVLVQSCRFSPEEVVAGQDVTAVISFVNTSRELALRNMTITAEAPGMTLLDETNCQYIDRVEAGAVWEVNYHYHVGEATPAGQYDIQVSLAYADENGGTHGASGTVKLTVHQPVEVQFDSLQMPEQVQVGDVVSASVQVMNLGHSAVHNVRAVLAVDGLTAGTLFLGNLAAETAVTGQWKITVGGLSGTSPYGRTEGTLTFYYEDETGQEYTEQAEVKTAIGSPFSGDTYMMEEEPSQWWAIMGALGGVLGLAVVVWLVRFMRAKREERDEEE